MREERQDKRLDGRKSLGVSQSRGWPGRKGKFEASSRIFLSLIVSLFLLMQMLSIDQPERSLKLEAPHIWVGLNVTEAVRHHCSPCEKDTLDSCVFLVRFVGLNLTQL